MTATPTSTPIPTPLSQLSAATALFNCVDAVRNWRAAVLLLGTLALGGVCLWLAVAIGVQAHVALGVLFGLVALVLLFYGFNAAGIMLMDEARGQSSRPVGAALLESLFTGHRLLLALLLFGLIYLLGLAVVALLLFVCKLPGLGPLLFAVVFPASIVVVGVAVFAINAVVFPLTAPAVWAGATTLEAVARVGAIARRRLLNVVVMMIVLFFIVGLVAAVVAALLVGGVLLVGALAVAILGTDVSLSIGAFLGSVGGGLGGGSGHMQAGLIGGGLLYMLALTAVGLVYVRGCCAVYLANLEGVDIEAIQARMRERMEAARRRAEALRAQAPPPLPADTQAQAPVPPAGPATRKHCPQCGAAVGPQDAFCGECGFRLAR